MKFLFFSQPFCFILACQHPFTVLVNLKTGLNRSNVFQCLDSYIPSKTSFTYDTVHRNGYEAKFLEHPRKGTLSERAKSYQ
jgi:hypothetical protein